MSSGCNDVLLSQVQDLYFLRWLIYLKRSQTPLAEALRPHSLEEVVGQKHLLGPGKPLRVAFESGRPHSMILWGPPGVGKQPLPG